MRTKLGHTPLWIASYKGHFDVVRSLVEKAGADITIPSSNGSTPFDISCQEGNIKIAKYLFRKDKNFSNSTSDGAKCLFMACFNGHLDIVEDIIKQFPNLINNINEFGQSPLWLASHNGSFETVKYLIEQGANISNVRALDDIQIIQNIQDIQNNNVSDAVNTMLFMSRAKFESPLIPSCIGMSFLHLLSCSRICNVRIYHFNAVLFKKCFTMILHFKFKGATSRL